MTTSTAQSGNGHQVAMVFDLNKCMGCRSRSVACNVLRTREVDADEAGR